MGMGTSMMLRLFVEEALKAEGIKATVTAVDLGSYKGTPTDIIVAPTDMESHLKNATAKVVYIKNLIDKKEVKEKVMAAVQDFQNPPTKEEEAK
jgi:PTS system ascorbate-specific IIB component